MMSVSHHVNEVWGKVTFLHLSVILFTGRGLPQCMLGYHPLPWEQSPWSRHPPAQCMLRDTVNKWAVCILLECNLVSECDYDFFIACNGLCGCKWHCSDGATVMYFCVQCCTWIGSIPILCNRDVWFQITYICIYTNHNRTMWTISQKCILKNAVAFTKDRTVWTSLSCLINRSPDSFMAVKSDKEGFFCRTSNLN